ncbi:MAG: C39 family peptidase [Eubacterium sp.]|nr:C39 family peptidase [Eubacterium sp.]
MTKKTLKTQTVKSGKAASPPSVPRHTGYQFSKWNKSFKKITSNLTVTATFKYANGFVKEKDKTYYYYKGKKVTGSRKIEGDTWIFNQKTGSAEGRIMGITYINQQCGVRENGKWTHTWFPNARTWNGYRLGNGACGITSCAMALTALRGKLTLPTDLNSIRCGFNGRGSNYDVGVLSARKYGLKGTVTSLTRDQMVDHLMKGHFIVVWVTRSIYGGAGNTRGGDVGSGGGHFVLIHGYKDGKFAVADPNNTSQTYIWSGKLNKWESFNSHLGNGSSGSYCVMQK